MTLRSTVFISLIFIGSSIAVSAKRKNNPAAISPLKPTVISEQVKYDTDDPAIWIHPQDATKSLVIGTDKDSDGGLYVFNLQGKIINKVTGLKRPNNVDIAYEFPLNNKRTDIAILTERETGKIRIYTMPDLKPIDNGGITVFDEEQEHFPMGIAIYTNPQDSVMYAIVGRKSGPSDNYLWQYKLYDNGDGNIAASVVRKFGKYSGKKEIESIAVDNESGYVYYTDEQFGIHKYEAHPDSGNVELALFGQQDFKEDVEGISIYKHKNGTGYILVSDQQANKFNVYSREGTGDDRHKHTLIASIPFSTIESDGSDVTNVSIGNEFPNGMFVAMTNGKTFHFYNWDLIQERINISLQK